MITLADNLKKRIKLGQKWQILSELQKNLEENNDIPKTSLLLLRRYECYLKVAGNIMVGCFVGMFSIVFAFVLFVLLLHLSI